ncbi:MAG: transcription antitermination factor NusB [Candidatus Eisenbacteria bacterium]|nr:transcription antitermination factor NusB [Candidatus Eisenbacteria bacterium]
MKRREAREITFRILYQAEIGGFELEATLSQVFKELKPSAEVSKYVSLLADQIGTHKTEIDGVISDVSMHWRLERMAVTDRNILRIAVSELLYIREVPARVAIDEAIELAKKYGDEGSGRFVNGILDTVARRYRAEELLERGTKDGLTQA